MNGMIKKYLPYVLIIFGVYLLVPLIFTIPGLNKFSAVAYYFILLATQVVCSAFYCAKHGLDFLFALIAPIAFLFTMLIYAGGFANFTNILLLVVYLVAGIFGLFLGDLAFGDERRKREKQEKQAAEDLLMQAKRRDEREREKMAQADEEPRRPRNRYAATQEKPKRAPRVANERPARVADDDDFDYDRYSADMDRELDERVNRLLNDE